MQRPVKQYSKISRFQRRLASKSGIIVLIVLWILVIISILAMTLGRNTSIESALAKNNVAQIRARFLSLAGVMFGMGLILEDSEDPQSAQTDTLYHCAVPQSEQAGRDKWFLNDSFDEGMYRIQYVQNHGSGVGVTYQGMQDEERRINLNGLTTASAPMLVSLLTLLGFDDSTASEVAYSVVDWIDSDETPGDENYGAESEYYEGLDQPYKSKNRPLESITEMLLIRGMTPEILTAIQDFITVYPTDGDFKINIETASLPVLQAVLRNLSGPATNTSIDDADRVAEKIVGYRAGNDGIENTADDQPLDFNEMNLNSSEKVLFLAVNQYQTRNSDYIRIRVIGKETQQGVRSTIETVVKRDDLSFLSWSRE